MKRKKNNYLIYGLGNLGYSVISQTMTNFYMFFGTSVLKMSGALVGVAIAISTFWDGFTDPIVGFLSDSYPILKMGNRRGYMFVATFGMALMNIAIWSVPVAMSDALKFLWIIIGLVVIESFNTLYSTPYMALGTDIAHSYNERTLVQVSKTCFFLLGMIVPSVLLFLFLPDTAEFPVGQLNPIGYRNMSLFTSAICLICGLICVFFTQNTIDRKHDNKFQLKEIFVNFINTFRCPELAKIIIGYSFCMLSGVMLTGVGMHFFTYCFHLTSGQITILLICLLGGNLLSQPLWFHLSTLNNKHQTLLSAIFVSITGSFLIIILFLLRFQLSQPFLLVAVTVFISGIGSGALYTLPTSMYSDAIVRQNRATKQNNTAMYSGVLTFSSNMVSSLALFVVGWLLDAIHFDPNVTFQSVGVQTGLALILFVGIQISLIVGFFIFSKIGFRYGRKGKIQNRKI